MRERIKSNLNLKWRSDDASRKRYYYENSFALYAYFLSFSSFLTTFHWNWKKVLASQFLFLLTFQWGKYGKYGNKKRASQIFTMKIEIGNNRKKRGGRGGDKGKDNYIDEVITIIIFSLKWDAFTDGKCTLKKWNGNFSIE